MSSVFETIDAEKQKKLDKFVLDHLPLTDGQIAQLIAMMQAEAATAQPKSQAQVE